MNSQEIETLYGRESELISWFNWYDEQVAKYMREMRMLGRSGINILELDSQAEIYRDELRDIRNKLQISI